MARVPRSSGHRQPNVDLKNSSFEQGATAWHFYFNEDDGKVVKGEGVMGSSCAKLVVGPQHRFDGLSQTIAPLDSQKMVFTSAVAAEGSDIRAYLHIECMNPNIDSPEAEYGVLATSESDDCPLNGAWTELSTSIKIPPRTSYVRVFACVEGTEGWALFDNFVLERQD